MKMKTILLPLIAITLCGCSKTSMLYKQGAYNSSNFDSNYYLKEDTKDFKVSKEIEETPLELNSYDGLKYLHPEDVGNYKWEYAEQDQLWGYNNNLGKVDEGFKLGVISKLYDGRVRCDGLYQQSRVQLDKIGYAAKFPSKMTYCNYFAFSCRGGSTLKESLRQVLKYNFVISFLTIDGDSYAKHTYHLNNIDVNTDNSSRTNLVSFYIDQTKVDNKFRLENTVAMEFSWECVSTDVLEANNLTDDRTIKEKDHLAIMLYEVFLGNSAWVK